MVGHVNCPWQYMNIPLNKKMMRFNVHKPTFFYTDNNINPNRINTQLTSINNKIFMCKESDSKQ